MHKPDKETERVWQSAPRSWLFPPLTVHQRFTPAGEGVKQAEYRSQYSRHIYIHHRVCSFCLIFNKRTISLINEGLGYADKN
jgi:hypothetical protein